MGKPAPVGRGTLRSLTVASSSPARREPTLASAFGPSQSEREAPKSRSWALSEIRRTAGWLMRRSTEIA